MKGMKRIQVLVLSLCLLIAPKAFAGSLEDQMIKAALNGNTAGVQAMLDKGANVDDRDANGGTALMYAAAEGNADM